MSLQESLPNPLFKADIYSDRITVNTEATLGRQKTECLLMRRAPTRCTTYLTMPPERRRTAHLNRRSDESLCLRMGQVCPDFFFKHFLGHADKQLLFYLWAAWTISSYPETDLPGNHDLFIWRWRPSLSDQVLVVFHYAYPWGIPMKWEVSE